VDRAGLIASLFPEPACSGGDASQAMSHVEPNADIAPDRRPLSIERRTSGIVDVRALDLGFAGHGVPPAVLICYDVEAFELAAFARLGIDMPPSIERSVKKRQAEFLMGRLAATDALNLLHHPPVGAASAAKAPSDNPTHQIPIGPSREPIWPAGITGSITHAGPYAAAVATDAAGITGIGIDIERRITPETRRSVEEMVLHPAEDSLLRAMAGEVPYEMLLTIAFSAKESFFKGAFATVGTYFDFSAVDITALDIPGGSIEVVLTRSLAAGLPEGRSFTLRTQFIDADTVLTSFVL
jgi:4'-phosphopantetheinyl transferase EntD